MQTALIFLTTKCGAIDGSSEKNIRIVNIPNHLVEQHPNFIDCQRSVNLVSKTLGNVKYRMFKVDGSLSNKKCLNDYISVLLSDEK